MSDRLSDHHRAMLEASAIDPAIIEERGYWTATTKAELQRLGFGTAQRNVPALVIPIYDVHGDVRLYQARPDTPRVKDGRTIKYETPAKAGLVLDVPRSIRDKLGDPGVPLWVTEGSKKVDAAISHGLACIGVVGVYGWRGTNDAGGKTALADMEWIAWNDGRKVHLAFDSDAMEKVEVHQALGRFAALLASKGAKVRYVYIPSTDGRKVGLDDYLAGGGRIDELLRNATDELERLPGDEPDAEPDWEPSPEALSAGKRLLDAPDLLERAGETIRALGVAGDLINAQILYLALNSRFLPQPINAAIVGPSSAGKSHLVKNVVATFPESATYTLDSMSERALIYSEVDLKHRYLIVTEAAGLHYDGIGAMLMRALTWGGDLRYSTVVKTNAGPQAVEIHREGPTGLITTTTKKIEAELETRLLTVHVADTADVTRQIMLANARRRNGNQPEPPDLEPWHALQWWLATEGDHEVTIPYAERLAELLPADLVRMRRDHEQIDNLISASAILHQRQRERDERGRIVATRADYELVYGLTAGIFGAIAAEGVTPVIRETVLAVRMQTGDKPTCSIQQIAGHLGLAHSTAQSRVYRAVRGGWIVNEEQGKGKPARLSVGDPLPEERPALPNPDDLFDNTHTTTTSDAESVSRYAAHSADADAANEPTDTVPSTDLDPPTYRQRTEPLVGTHSADAGAENGERTDLPTGELSAGERVLIVVNYGRFKECRHCKGHDWWWTVEEGPGADYCLHCVPPPADARIEREVGARA